MITEEKFLIGDRIRRLRKFHNLKQAEFAEKAGVSKTSQCDYEKNKTTPHENTLFRIANYFGVRIEWLLYGKGEMYPTADESGLPEPAKEQLARMQAEADDYAQRLAAVFKLSVPEVNELLEIVDTQPDLLRSFVRAISMNDEQAKKELMRKLLE
jgi:transcriptional regulator with XRE-family HTH domain